MKTVSDNEIIDTSRGHKRIGALFDENAMLNATNKDLLLVQADLLAALQNACNVMAAIVTGDLDGLSPNSPALIEARAAIAKAKGE
jgi:hypothetical protein